MNTRKPVVLLAPLDWGLGHTVRCIPIIEKLISLDCEIIVACNSKQRTLLESEFDNLRFTELVGYNVGYGKTRSGTLLKIISQVPRILTVINREHRWLKDFLARNHVDAVISDNRYGCFSPRTPSIFITHQLSVKSGFGNLVDRLIQRRLYKYINRFSACWIPDWKPKDISAAGDLSHPRRLPITTIDYIGCLSRLKECTPASPLNDLLIILSGPEPQRTIFEKILLVQLRSFKGSAILVRGLPEGSSIASTEKVRIFNYKSSKDLQHLMCNSLAIISRSGYTSIMDLLKLRRKAILVPTPGQTEQEYLAVYAESKKMGIMMEQRAFNLQEALRKLHTTQNELPSGSMDEYGHAVEKLVKSLQIAT